MPKKPNKIPPIQPLGIGLLTPIEAKTHGLSTKRNEDPSVNLKYYDSQFECFSDWTSDELKAFSKFVTNFCKSNWNAINASGGKRGSKAGFGMTKHKDKSKLPKSDVLNRISPDIDFFELRVSSRARVHGFRSVSTFFLVWLDRLHKIYPE